MRMFASLRSRIIASIVLILLAMQIAGFSVLRAALFDYADDTVAHELDTGARVLEQVMRQDAQRLQQAVSVLASDFAFREAIATRDRATAESALRNHGGRVGAQIALLVQPDGTVSIDTLHPEAAGRPFAFTELLQGAAADHATSTVSMIDGVAYQLVAVPVRAPVTIAIAVMGFRIDDALAAEVAALTSMDVSFYTAPTASTPVVVASTLPAETRDALQAALRAPTSVSGAVLDLSQHRYRVRLIDIASADHAHIGVVMQRALDAAYAPFEHLQATLFGLTLAALVAAIVLSFVSARSVTRPLAVLAETAQRIGRGEFAGTIPQGGASEVRMLASTLTRMRSDLAERESRIVDLAYRDVLTALPNRVMFHERVDAALAQARDQGGRFAVLMLDLDHFKYVNDALGHRYGDVLLREVGHRIASAVQAWQGMAARLGGDEFAILVPGADAAVATEVARAIADALDTPIDCEGQSLDVGASIGIAVYPDHADDRESLLSRGDMAMYSAKHDRVGVALYNPRLDQGAQERLTLLSELRRAIDGGQFALHYQPKLCLKDGDVRFVEALVRWNHPQRGQIPPDRFIPFAEQTGLIKIVTRWVVQAAVAQIARWDARDLRLGIAINVSARDLLDAELIGVIERELRTHGVTPGCLRLEITESAVMDDPRTALSTLHRLRALGLPLSIDDFGTGYSSLAYLHKLPVDEIKIDRSFVRNMLSSKDDDTIVRATIDLGHNMGLKVVAEGVEDHATIARLRSYGCDSVQGFALARPQPADVFEHWMFAHREETSVRGI